MAARKWSCLPNVTGKYTQQHFELVSIPPIPATSEDNLSHASSVSSFLEEKLKEKPLEEARYYSKHDKIYFGIDHPNGSRDLLPSTSGARRFTSDGCISAGSIVMRVSTDASKRTLDINGRNFKQVKEQNSVVSTQRLSTPSPSTISAIVDTEFAAHNQRKIKKWFGKQRSTQEAAISFKGQQQCSSSNVVPGKLPLVENVDERLKIKIQHHRNMTEPTRCDVKPKKNKQFKKRISKIMKFPSKKYPPTAAPTIERKSTISFKSSDEIIFDECDYVKKTKAHRPVETFAALPLSEDEYDSSESSLATKSVASIDDSGYFLRRGFQSTENLRYTDKHRERCESLLKEAERIRSGYRPTKFDYKGSYCNRTFYTPSSPMVPVPAAYCVSKAPIDSLIKNSVELLSERLNNKLKESVSLNDTACDARTCKTQVNKESNDSLQLPIAINVDQQTSPPATVSTEQLYSNADTSDVSYERKINLLRRRLADWKTKSCKSQESTTQKVTKKKRTESKRSLKSVRQDRQEEKEIKQVESKEFTKSREYERNNTESEEGFGTKKERRSVLKKVIPSWLRFFGTKKVQEECPNIQSVKREELLDRKSTPAIDKSILKGQKCKC